MSLIMKLKDRILEIETPPLGLTIPEYQEKLGEVDEFKVMRAIAELQIEQKMTLTSFYKGYEPDACAFYLARYAPRKL